MMNKNILNLFPELGKDLQGLYTTGVLPSQKVKGLIEAGAISACAPFTEEQIQPASIDLRLGRVAYRVQASFLPGRYSTVEKKIQELVMSEIDLKRPTVFEKGCVYIVPLMEELVLPKGISAKANPRSTTGRLDIFTRLLTDYGTEFERVPEGYRGRLYIEVVPRTFTILAREGMRLNQLRFIRGNPPSPDTQLNELNENETLVYLDEDRPGEAQINKGLRVSVNLQGSHHSEIIGYKAKKNAPVIDLQKANYYDPAEFWDPIYTPKTKGIILNPDDFYILASKEKIRIPPDFAAEMVAYDPSMGEFRIHYAGFFDPGFGYGLSDIKGTHAVLEVRSHEVPFLIEDGQIVGRLIYERLLDPSEKVYGTDIGSSYQCQGLSLSKQFKHAF
ncbi:MAG TPA: 2'-deoxycytidine 5'-triphosphate deaminase [Nitrospiria bacterium]|nr:2'-deoxycytidine 5'-triphosphate deaminase [Nitrospiria bacterium]